MREKSSKRLRKTSTVLLKNQGKTVKVDLFPAEQFEGRPGAEPGRFRLRVDGSWDMPGGKWTFYDLPGVMLRLGGILAEVLGKTMPATQDPPPWPRGTLVAAGDSFRGSPIASRTYTEPFRGPDGRWCVFLCGRLGDGPVPVDEMKKFGR